MKHIFTEQDQAIEAVFCHQGEFNAGHAGASIEHAAERGDAGFAFQIHPNGRSGPGRRVGREINQAAPSVPVEITLFVVMVYGSNVTPPMRILQMESAIPPISRLAPSRQIYRRANNVGQPPAQISGGVSEARKRMPNIYSLVPEQSGRKPGRRCVIAIGDLFAYLFGKWRQVLDKPLFQRQPADCHGIFIEVVDDDHERPLASWLARVIEQSGVAIQRLGRRE